MSFTKQDAIDATEHALNTIEGSIEEGWTLNDLKLAIRAVAGLYQNRDRNGKCDIPPRMLNAMSALFREMYRVENGEYPPDPDCGRSFELIHKHEN